MDIKLYYSEHGSGEPLILLHGNGEDSGYFKEQIRFFSKHFRVIAVDTRGHGRSPRGNAPFTLTQFAEDLRCFMLEMGIKKAHILGFSDGANIAMLFCAEISADDGQAHTQQRQHISLGNEIVGAPANRSRICA